MDEGAGISHMAKKVPPPIIRITRKINIIAVNRIIYATQYAGWGKYPATNSSVYHATACRCQLFMIPRDIMYKAAYICIRDSN